LLLPKPALEEYSVIAFLHGNDKDPATKIANLLS
jgi:hypothetical protein